MDRTLHLVGKTSNEMFMLRYPRSMLNFCDYDLAYFAENAIAVCDEALREGELDFDRVTELRNSLKGAHVYIEHHIRTVYDKIVLDCWIDYVCRRDNVGTGTLWNRFMPCNSAFEKAVFMRLCEYRYNRAINEWLNLVRVQDYARNKISFVFAGELKSASEAAARRNYFDLMFSVTARELGCRIEELGVTKVFSIGRVPSSPFMFPNISKDVVKNLLSDFDYSEDYSDTENYGGLADQIAMDAFSYMKAGLAGEYNSYNISRSEMENSPEKVYMPCGLKSVMDLEIDALIESGGWLARCKRCGRYFVRDAEHPEEYCSLFTPGGKTCLEIYELENPRSVISPALERSFREITDEMYSRVDDTMSLEEYEGWKIYLDALHDKVEKGEIPVEELEDFISYSRSLDISRSNPVLEVPKKEPELFRERERVVKPFIPQRIDRSELQAQQPVKPAVEEYDEDEEQTSQQRGSFFTSPTVQRQKSRENAPMAHIIRADRSAEQHSAPQGGGFTPFGQTEPVPGTAPAPQTEERYTYSSFDRGFSEQRTAPQPQPEQQEFDIARVSEKLKELIRLEESKEAAKRQERAFEVFGGISYDSGDSLENFGNMFDLERDSAEVQTSRSEASAPAEMPAPVEISVPEEAPAPAETPAPKEQPAPKPKIIRKNAAAISAYGKISGAPVVTATSVQKRTAEEHFRDVGSIFDAVERSSEPVAPAQESAARAEYTAPVNEEYSYFVRDEVSAPVQESAARTERTAPASEDYNYFTRDEVSAPAQNSVTEAVYEQPTSYEPVAEPAPAEKPVKRRARKSPEPKKADESKAEPVSAERVIPDVVTEENVPSGIWTEERNLFSDAVTDEELEMLKEKKRAPKSNKTQRLFDAIMREPEDNPNVRKNKKV